MPFSRGSVEELAALHGEPDWLLARRLEAFDLYERMPLPDTKREEEWRQVDLKPLDLQAFEAFEAPDGAVPGARIDGAAGTLRQRGSAVGRAYVDPDVLRRGVIFCPLSVAATEYRELVERHLFSLVKPERDKFAALHAALLSGGAFLFVPDGVAIERPIVSQFWSSGGGAAVLPHTLIVAGKGSSFNYLDAFLSTAQERPALASGSAEVLADEGARIGYVTLQRWGDRTWQFANHRVHLRRDAQLRAVTVGLGGRFAKTRVEVILDGPGAAAELKGLFFGSGNQYFDFRTLQDHIAPQTTSDLLFKGALRDSARSMYAGLVRVGPGARRADANQANRNILLSDRAKAGSIPMLEILNNDIVRCSHGATVGPVDPEHLFYLQSRGIARPEAQRMIVRGFLGEVLDRIPVGQARELVEQELTSRIG